jgi:DNA-binding NarL/FixJ family response regulator
MLANKYTLAIVDDHPVVIEGLKTLLVHAPDIKQVVSFSTGREFMSFLEKNEVSIVLLDIMLPDINGIDLCRDIRRAAPQTIVLALSNQSERSIILRVLQNGAGGYLLKNASGEELLYSINAALEGEIVFSKEVKEIMARASAQEMKGIPALTRREKEILRLVADGKTTVMIADMLNLSPLTIETHRRNLLQKFEVRNVAELIMLAAQQHLL